MKEYLAYVESKFALEECRFHLTHLVVQDRRRESLLCLLVGCYTMVLCAKSTIGRSYIFVWSNTFRHFAMGPSPLSSNGRLFKPLVQKLNLLLRES